MLRGCLGLLVLLGVGEGLARAQRGPSLPPYLPTQPPAVCPGATPADPPSPQPGAPADKGGTDEKGEKPDKQPDPGTDAQAGAGQAAPSQACQGAQGAQADAERQRLAELMALRRDHCGPCERVWARAGFLLWWVEDAPAPGPLVTTGSGSAAGVLGDPSTRVLFGNDRFHF